MGASIARALESWIAGGRHRIGQVLIRKQPTGYALTQEEDAARVDLESYSQAQDAREIARYDDAGRYRPLKSAPTLRHGWILHLPDAASAHAALDYLYPAALGTFLAFERKELDPVPFRETANRQTGMYAIVARMNAAQADAVAGRFCTSHGGCLKTILWGIDAGIPPATLPREKFDPAIDQRDGHAMPCIPLLCAEPCNLLVAAAREEIRASLKRP